MPCGSGGGYNAAAWRRSAPRDGESGTRRDEDGEVGEPEAGHACTALTLRVLAAFDVRRCVVVASRLEKRGRVGEVLEARREASTAREKQQGERQQQGGEGDTIKVY